MSGKDILKELKETINILGIDGANTKEKAKKRLESLCEIIEKK